jgi:integrase
MPSKRKAWSGRVYTGRDPVTGRELYDWVGRFPTKRERDDAVAERRRELREQEEQAQQPASVRVTCGAWVDAFLARYERDHKDSSYGSAAGSLKRFRADFADRPLGSVERHEAIVWAERVPPSCMPMVVTLFNAAVDHELLDRNPFRGLGHRTRGRRDQAPPTVEQLEALLDACVVLGEYGPQMRSLIVFGAYTGMRPGELFALEWTDIDLRANRIDVQRRVYKSRLDIPKSNKARRIALPPPARDALMRQPTRSQPLVFLSKNGKRMSQPSLSGYWAQVKARAGLDFDFYLATKHYGVHLLYRLGLSTRAIGAQMGWSEQAIENLLVTYGHIDLVALGEVDALYADNNVVPLRAAERKASNA